MKTIPLIFLLVFYCSNITAQVFRNLNFEKACDSSKTGLCYWDLSWGNEGSVSQQNDGRTKCLLIKGSKQNDVGFTEQSAVINPAKGIQIITVSASVRSENIEGKG